MLASHSSVAGVQRMQQASVSRCISSTHAPSFISLSNSIRPAGRSIAQSPSAASQRGSLQALRAVGDAPPTPGVPGAPGTTPEVPNPEAERKRRSKKMVDLLGEVVRDMSNGMFNIKLENGVNVIGHLSGKIRQNRIKILVGDKVTVELSPYDLTKGRITFRHGAMRMGPPKPT